MCSGTKSRVGEARYSLCKFHQILVFHKYALRCSMTAGYEQREMLGFCHDVSGPTVSAELACF